jgi:hypothetical protein
MSDHAVMLVYCVCVWIAFFGSLAFHRDSSVTRWAKAALAISFVVLMIESVRYGELH